MQSLNLEKSINAKVGTTYHINGLEYLCTEKMVRTTTRIRHLLGIGLIPGPTDQTTHYEFRSIDGTINLSIDTNRKNVPVYIQTEMNNGLYY